MRKGRSEGWGWKSVVEGIGEENSIEFDARYHVVEDYKSFKVNRGCWEGLYHLLDI